ncbi:MAG: hypothetical protein LBH07_08710 [Treponema sp.]|jgi:hypothetical protein|nr:hypothetical protein [Treponema sp.]
MYQPILGFDRGIRDTAGRKEAPCRNPQNREDQNSRMKREKLLEQARQAGAVFVRHGNLFFHVMLSLRYRDAVWLIKLLRSSFNKFIPLIKRGTIAALRLG